MDTMTLTNDVPTLEVRQQVAHELDLGIEELDEMIAPWDWGDFGEGFAAGASIGGAFLAGAAMAT